MRPLELKRIEPRGIAEALEKAAHYRLLNEPSQAESICRDVIAADASNQYALRALVLALADQVEHRRPAGPEARDVIARLEDAFDREYYAGVVLERESQALLGRSHMVRSAAYDGFRQAMECFERAELLRPGNVDAVLRWNSCARAIEREKLEPEPPGPVLQLE
ncbi:MAG: hypothetical protein SFX73_09740 [Kofleriaceae bacterium]|nr:hypothetical protein [Kofleriaceae bacterium]